MKEGKRMEVGMIGGWEGEEAREKSDDIWERRKSLAVEKRERER